MKAPKNVNKVSRTNGVPNHTLNYGDSLRNTVSFVQVKELSYWKQKYYILISTIQLIQLYTVYLCQEAFCKPSSHHQEDVLVLVAFQ